MYGIVGLDINADEVRNELSFLEQDSSIHINLNSPGGSAFDGFEIRQMLLDWPGHITIEVKAMAASSATIIATGADVVSMNEGALFMIHEPSSLSFGTAQEHQKSINMLNGVGASAADVYSKKSGLPKKQCKKLMFDETWMTASEAKKSGFVDEVKGISNEDPPMFNYAAFQNAPTALMAYQKDFPLNSAKNKKGNLKMTKTKEKVMAPPKVSQDVKLSGAELWTEINSRARSVSMTAEQQLSFKNEMMGRENGATSDEIQEAVLQATATPENAPFSRSNANVTKDPALQHSANTLSATLFHKMTGTTPEDEEVKAHMSLDETGFTDVYLSSMGLNPTRMTAREKMKNMFNPQMSGGMHSASDFPAITADAISKTLSHFYEAKRTPLWSLVAPTLYDGYHTNHSVQIGGTGPLEKVGEGGEIKHGTRGEEVEKSAAEAYSKQFALTEKLWRMGGMDALGNFSRDGAFAAASTTNKLIANLLLANSGAGEKLSDNKTLFHADRGNIATTGSALSIASLSEGRKFIRNTKGIEPDNTPMGLAPKFLVVGSELETQAEQILATITPNDSDRVNPFAQKLTLLVESRLEGKAWRMFADPAMAPVLGGGYMDGMQGPDIETHEAFDRLGLGFRIILRFGTGLKGWRGCWMNEGE